MIAAIAAVVSALAGAASAGYGIYASQNASDPDPGHGWESWQRAKTPAGNMMQQLMSSPMFEGSYIPWNRNALGEDAPGQMTNRFQPPQALESLYGHYLSRSYGLPETIARGMSSAAIQPLRAQDLPQGAMTAPQAKRFSQQPQVGQLVESAMGSQQPAAIRNFDYLQNAANLSQFNAWRAQQVPRIIG